MAQDGSRWLKHGGVAWRGSWWTKAAPGRPPRVESQPFAARMKAPAERSHRPGRRMELAGGLRAAYRHVAPSARAVHRTMVRRASPQGLARGTESRASPQRLARRMWSHPSSPRPSPPQGGEGAQVGAAYVPPPPFGGRGTGGGGCSSGRDGSEKSKRALGQSVRHVDHHLAHGLPTFEVAVGVGNRGEVELPRVEVRA